MDSINTNHSPYSDPINSLEASLHGLSQRNKAIAANIANAATKGYVRTEVSFEDALQNELQNSNELELDTRRTDEDHFPTDIMNLKETVQSELDFGGDFNGINNVNVEKEMIDLTQTGLRFKAVSTMTKRYFENIRGIIRG
jgi:flagellar basal-body rod protein FlgB